MNDICNQLEAFYLKHLEKLQVYDAWIMGRRQWLKGDEKRAMVHILVDMDKVRHLPEVYAFCQNWFKENRK